MIPTTQLRFIERKTKITLATGEMSMTTYAKSGIRVLQQWWVPIYDDKTSAHYKGEWRDVPLETEE